jgi:hypothetical protein
MGDPHESYCGPRVEAAFSRLICAGRLRHAAAVLIAVTALPAFADGGALSWTRGPGAETCADGPSLEAAVEQKLGRPVFAPAAGPGWTLEGSVTRGAQEWEAEITLRGASGKVAGLRRHRSRQVECAELDDALVIILALLIESAPPVEPTTPPVGPGPRTPLKVTPASALAAPELEAHLALWPLLGWGQRPGPAAGARVDGLIVLRGPVGFEVGAETWFPSRFAAGAQTFSIAEVALRTGLCLSSPKWSRVQLAGCAGVRAGIFQLFLDAPAAPYAPLAPLLDAVARGQLVFSVTRVLELSAGVGGGVRLLRPRFSHLGSGGDVVELYTPPLLTFELGAGVSFAL